MKQRRTLTTTSKNLRPTRTRSTTLARAKVKVKTKESAGHAERLSECSKGGWYGKGGKGKGGQWQATRKGDGKGSKGGWTSAMVKACFGCGSTTHLIQDCPHRTTQKVQEVREEADEPEILFIGHTSMTSDQEPWHQVTHKRKMCKRLQYAAPPGLEEVTKMRFRVLDEDEEDEDDEETRHVRAVDSWVCEASANWKADKKSWARLGVGEIVVDSAADESCWPKGQGDAFSTKPSKKNIILKTANGGEMGHYGEKEVIFRTGTDVDVVGLKFQVTDVKKPLLAVRRLVEKGNVVMFGPEPDQNFIQHVQTGKKIPMEKRGGAFVIKAHFVKKVDAGFTRQV